MKAKEYLDYYIANDRSDVAASRILDMLWEEFGQLKVARQVRSREASSSILDELEGKWYVICRREPTLVAGAFRNRVAFNSQIVFERWRGSAEYTQWKHDHPDWWRDHMHQKESVV